MPRAMIENGVSTTRIGKDGRRMPSATRPEMGGGGMTQKSRLVGVEEELAKMTEGGSHHHPEEMDINLVVNTDRRVSLMVTLLGPRLLMFFPCSPNVCKNRCDHLLHQFQLLKILARIFRADLQAYLKDFYSTAPERVRVMTIREKCFTKAT